MLNYQIYKMQKRGRKFLCYLKAIPKWIVTGKWEPHTWVVIEHMGLVPLPENKEMLYWDRVQNLDHCICKCCGESIYKTVVDQENE